MARVLIVDDEPRIRDLIREHLQYAGFTCAEAGDGTQALAELANGGIDLVILDIMMPIYGWHDLPARDAHPQDHDTGDHADRPQRRI
mgnify:CR=1 FL=1